MAFDIWALNLTRLHLLIKIQHNPNQISDSHLQLVFTLSGAPSTPLPFMPVEKVLHDKTQLTLTKRVSKYNGLYSVYQGVLDGENAVVKIMEDLDASDKI